MLFFVEIRYHKRFFFIRFALNYNIEQFLTDGII